MNLQHILDCAIRDKECKPYGEGYIISKSKLAYDRYMSNEGWKRYLAGMSDNHRKQYEEGDGGEINEKRGRWGIYPPKMACYGSSSRIIYTCLREVGGIKFEHQLPTRVGSRPANLDAYLNADIRDIFIEAKCREIYDSHTKIDIGNAYKPVYEYIKQCNKKFGYSDEPSKANNKFRCSFYYDGEQIIRFDIKQLICHFLGIAANYLKPKKGENAMNNIRFVYFIYNPNELGNEALEEVYDNTKKEIDKIKIKDLFKAVFEYQKKNLEIEKEMPIFEFVLADQNDIIDKLK
ncbi:MAG: hypothetical protein II216_03120 [Alistipes sp.]|nr:hypothetical protein [Alistipes sp.]